MAKDNQEDEARNEQSEQSQIQEFQENAMWTELHQSMRCRPDPHICNLLEITGYRTYQSLKDMEDTDITEIEQFVRSGEINDIILKGSLSGYLGTFSDNTKFRFLPWEKKFLKKMVAYVKANHSESNRALGNPKFTWSVQGNAAQANKKRKRVELDDNSSDQAEDQAHDCVLSVDLNMEISTIRRLITDYCKKIKIPQDLRKKFSDILINVKVVSSSNEKGSMLAAEVKCPLCCSKQTIHKNHMKAWVTSNMNRHIKIHLKKISESGSLNCFVTSNLLRSQSGMSSVESEESEIDDLLEQEVEHTPGDRTDSTENSADEETSTSNVGSSDSLNPFL